MICRRTGLTILRCPALSSTRNGDINSNFANLSTEQFALHHNLVFLSDRQDQKGYLLYSLCYQGRSRLQRRLYLRFWYQPPYTLKAVEHVKPDGFVESAVSDVVGKTTSQESIKTKMLNTAPWGCHKFMIPWENMVIPSRTSFGEHRSRMKSYESSAWKLAWDMLDVHEFK